MEPLATFRNDEYGITASVFPHVKGFSVALSDDEAGETAGFRIFTDRTKAEGYAAGLVK